MKNQAEAFKLKMRSLTLPLLQIFDNHLDVIAHQLETAKEKTPNLFLDVPMIIDLEMIAAMNLRINVSELSVLLKKYGIRPVGVQMLKKEGDILTDEVRKAGMAIFNPMKHESYAQEQISTVAPTQSKNTESRVPENHHNTAKLITKPIRSGQQVYAEGGDLIVISSVSHGAELLADGNIHVYGALRGRALAGIQGNINARIFCQNLEADLLSIAGRYVVSEVIQKYKKEGMQQVYIEDDKLQIAAL
jgi:septum site-determining protein MinC